MSVDQGAGSGGRWLGPKIHIDPSPTPSVVGSVRLDGQDSFHHKNRLIESSMYNALALLFVGAVAMAAQGILQLFSSFFRPLLWAVLGGAALFKFNTFLAQAIESWLEQLVPTDDTTDSPTLTQHTSNSTVNSHYLHQHHHHQQQHHQQHQYGRNLRRQSSQEIGNVNEKRDGKHNGGADAEAQHIPLVLAILFLPFTLASKIVDWAVESYKHPTTRWRVVKTILMLVAANNRRYAWLVMWKATEWALLVYQYVADIVDWIQDQRFPIVIIIAIMIIVLLTAKTISRTFLHGDTETWIMFTAFLTAISVVLGQFGTVFPTVMGMVFAGKFLEAVTTKPTIAKPCKHRGNNVRVEASGAEDEDDDELDDAYLQEQVKKARRHLVIVQQDLKVKTIGNEDSVVLLSHKSVKEDLLFKTKWDQVKTKVFKHLFGVDVIDVSWGESSSCTMDNKTTLQSFPANIYLTRGAIMRTASEKIVMLPALAVDHFDQHGWVLLGMTKTSNTLFLYGEENLHIEKDVPIPNLKDIEDWMETICKKGVTILITMYPELPSPGINFQHQWSGSLDFCTFLKSDLRESSRVFLPGLAESTQSIAVIIGDETTAFEGRWSDAEWVDQVYENVKIKLEKWYHMDDVDGLFFMLYLACALVALGLARSVLWVVVLVVVCGVKYAFGLIRHYFAKRFFEDKVAHNTSSSSSSPPSTSSPPPPPSSSSSSSSTAPPPSSSSSTSKTPSTTKGSSKKLTPTTPPDASRRKEINTTPHVGDGHGDGDGDGGGVVDRGVKRFIASLRRMQYSRPVQLFLKADRKVIVTAKPSVQSFVSLVVILGLIVGMIGVSVFTIVRVHHESQTILKHWSRATLGLLESEALESLRIQREDIATFINGTANQSYHYAREYAMTKGAETWGASFNITELENGLVKMWEDFNNNNSVGNVDHHRVDNVATQMFTVKDQCVAKIKDVIPPPEEQTLFTKLSNVGSMLFENDVHKSVTETVGALDYKTVQLARDYTDHAWSFLVQNVRFATWSFRYFFSMIAQSTMNVVNFILELSLFLSALFFLLSAEYEEYLPMRLLKIIVPKHLEGQVSAEIYKSIDGVFLTALRMGLFHGLFMWLTLTIFGDGTLLAIPSFVAFTLAVIPVLPSFVVAIPTCLTLYFSDADMGQLDAMTFFALHFYLYWEVGPAIYASMNKSLPYLLVNLSIVGGMASMGMQGAILGPLSLAGFATAINLSIMMNNIHTPT